MESPRVTKFIEWPLPYLKSKTYFFAVNEQGDDGNKANVTNGINEEVTNDNFDSYADMVSRSFC